VTDDLYNSLFLFTNDEEKYNNAYEKTCYLEIMKRKGIQFSILLD
jgi:hypothetical protein